MAKGSKSQLKRLKSALRESGVARDQKSKGVKKRKVEPKEISKLRDQFNPFEVQINKAKFAVGGRKLKGTQGRPGAAASLAEELRRETLGRERQQKGRVGGVVDHRFGEGRADLTLEQIQAERFLRERQKSKKRRDFSLQEEDEEAGLTHLGQSLSAMDDFGPAPISDDEDMGPEMVGRTNFGGFEDTPLEENEIIGEDGVKRKKTRDEIYQEIIAKSKEGRYERQRQLEEDEDARKALDAEIDDIQMLLRQSVTNRPSEADGINPDRLREIQEESQYDKAVNEMKFDRRAKATDRTKTEEELIEEEVKRLYEQEAARMKRMRGEDLDEVDDSSYKRKRAAQGDDLSDDFQSGDESDADSETGDFGLGVNATASTQVELDSDVQDSDEAEDEEDSEDDTEGQTIDIDDSVAISEVESTTEDASDNGDFEDHSEESDDDDDLPSDELLAAAKAELARRGKALQATSKKPKTILKTAQPIAIVEDPSELKFIYKCPASIDQLLAITKSLKVEDVLTALYRIRLVNRPELNPANKGKLSKYVTILVDYVLSSDIPKKIADYCVTQIHDLSTQYWEPSTQHFLDTLEEIRQAMYKNMSVCWQSRELRYFALVGQIWSSSDAYHKVATPSFLVVSQYLAQNSDQSDQGKAIKVVLCAILAHWVRDSKRYIPECISTLITILGNTEHGADQVSSQPIDIDNLEKVKSSDIYYSASRLVEQFAMIYISKPAYSEIFAPFIPLLQDSDLREKIAKSINNSSTSRRPLALQSHRPIPLATYIPKFEESFSLDKKSYDRNADRASDAKMKAEIRDARRGAVRVLRRDAAFEARENAKEKRGKDAVYSAKMKKVENRIRQKDV